MQWKALLSQSGVIFIAVFLGVRSLSPTPTEVTPLVRDALQAPLHSLEVRLDKVTTMLAGQQQPGSKPLDQGASTISSDEITRNVRTMLGILSRLETKEAPVPSPPPSLRSSPSASAVPLHPLLPVSPIGWIQSLSEHKHEQVNEIFREQAVILSEKMAAEAGPPSLDKLQTIMEENDQAVKHKLKSILNEEEYRSFVDSLPQPPPRLRP